MERLNVSPLGRRYTSAQVSKLVVRLSTTDVPPPETAAAGHDRCIVLITPENVDAWLNPDGSDLAAQYAILDDRGRPYYEHLLAA